MSFYLSNHSLFVSFARISCFMPNKCWRSWRLCSRLFRLSIPLLLGMGDLIHSPVFKCYLNTDDSHIHSFSPCLTCVPQNARTTIHPTNKYLLITYYVRGAVLGPGSLARVRNYSDELNRMGRQIFLRQTVNCIITNYNECTEGKECCSKNIGAYHIDWPKPHLKSKMQCVLTNKHARVITTIVRT